MLLYLQIHNHELPVTKHIKKCHWTSNSTQTGETHSEHAPIASVKMQFLSHTLLRSISKTNPGFTTTVASFPFLILTVRVGLKQCW